MRFSLSPAGWEQNPHHNQNSIGTVGWRGGTAPPRSRQTGRDSLPSSGLLLRLGSRRLIPVTGLAQVSLRSPQPSLQGHYSPFITTTPQSAPVRRIRYSRLRLFGLGVLPFPLTRGTTARLVPEFRTRARTTLMPPLHRTPPGQERDHPPGSSRSNLSHPGFDVVVQDFDASSEGSLSLIFVVLT